MLTVKTLNDENKIYFYEYIRENNINYRSENAIIMPCIDGNVLSGIIGCHVMENSAIVDLFYSDEGIEILVIKSLLNVLELRGIYDIYLKISNDNYDIYNLDDGQIINEKHYRFFRGCRFKEILQDGNKLLYLNLRGYFDSDPCKIN